jgi:adenosylcobinamide kinase/adenosylcobinamide-phosphate guanylyltransferase
MDGVVTRIAMARQTILVTGGARSGKSRYAEEHAQQAGARLCYLATAEPEDEEMLQRITEHKKRRGNRWTTVEEPMELTAALLSQRGKADCVLVDCLTLWLSNVLIRRDEKSATAKVEELVETLPQLDFHLILVTNEVGWGIVPDNPLARQFRDLSGRANERIAQVADEVVLMVAGIPLMVKKGKA